MAVTGYGSAYSALAPGVNLGSLPQPGTVGGPTSIGGNVSQRQAQSTMQSTSNSYIPDYAESPILREIAQYSRSMAPQVYQWGMDQYNKNQGNIDTMMRNAMTYASPQRIAAEMGRAEAGVMQGAEAGRQNAIRDLQSFGIDPSSGRYAALDKANQVMAGASAAGAGNVQREATTAAGAQMQAAAQGLSEQNYQLGYGASNAMNQLLGTAMQLKYPPLGTTQQQTSQSTDTSTGSGFNIGGIGQGGGAGGAGGGGAKPATHMVQWGNPGMAATPAQAPWHEVAWAKGGPVGYQAGGATDDDATTGGFVSNELSPSDGSQTDDVQARLNAGEFVIPKDVAQWKGQEFFYKLMAQARKMRATAGSDGTGYQESNGNGTAALGYGAA
jgi:hypothetical protein